ncbi:MAG: hypothetical protein ABI123_07595 [Ginsengibacter sp.]
MVYIPKIFLESAKYHLIFTQSPSDYFINKDGITIPFSIIRVHFKMSFSVLASGDIGRGQAVVCVSRTNLRQRKNEMHSNFIPASYF